MNQYLIGILTTLGFTLIGWCFAIYMRTSNTKNVAFDDFGKRLDKIDQQLATLTVQVSPLWAAVQSKIAKDLTHPHPQFAEMDTLLEELEALTITPAGRARLQVLLDERIESHDPEVSEAEKRSARLLEGVMEKVLLEAAGDHHFDEVKMVGVADIPKAGQPEE